MKCHSSVGWSLSVLCLAAFVCSTQDLQTGSFQSSQVFEVASDVLSAVGQGQQTWQLGFAPVGQAIPVAPLVPDLRGQTVERLPMHRVPHRQSVHQQGPHGHPVAAAPMHHVPHGRIVERFPPQHRPGGDGYPMHHVPHGQSVRQRGPHGHPVAAAPMHHVPHGRIVERFPPQHRPGGEGYPRNYGQSERVSGNWWAYGVPHGQLVAQVPVDLVPQGQTVERISHVPYGTLVRNSHDHRQLMVPIVHTKTADTIASPVVPVSVEIPQVQPVVQFPSENPVVTYTRMLERSVVAECKDKAVLVVVKTDLLGIGQLIQPSDVTLGGCAPTGRDDSAGLLVFYTGLQGCGSKLTMSADELVYTFTLLYTPRQLDSLVVGTNAAAVSVECHYLRLHNVSRSIIKPAWVPLATRRSETHVVFNLKLMSDDWQSPRASKTYFLGDLINIEASVSVAHHVPQRVFVDGCVATLVPNVKAVPRYAFIENHGCLVDAKLTRSHSHFLRRRQPDKLQFKLAAFRFSGDPHSSIYLTCLLKATPAAAETNFEYKACSFVANRWVATDGHDRVCGCCDASCSGRREWNQPEFKKELILGPIKVKEVMLRQRP